MSADDGDMATIPNRDDVAQDRPDRPLRIPRGTLLDEAAFAPRHRVLWLILLANLPVLVGIANVRPVMHPGVLYAELATIAACLVLGRALRGHSARATTVALGLMVGAGSLVHVGGGLTDLHIWFYAIAAMVALYQMWTPFLAAVGFVAVHHLGMGLYMPRMVFSSPESLAHPVLFSLLHAAFMLAEAAFLAYGWKIASDAERARRRQQRETDAQRAEQLRVEQELAEERARAAQEANAQLRQRQQESAALTERLVA